MRSTFNGRTASAAAAVCAAIGAAAPVALASTAGRAHAATKTVESKPVGITGGARILRGSEVELSATVEPNGVQTSYAFQWGTSSTSLTHQTTVTPVGNQITKVPVGQTITGLSGDTIYYYRVVVFAQGKDYDGSVRTFSLKGTELHFTVGKTISVPVGGSFTYSGVLGGLHSADQPVALQASRYPFHEAPTQLGSTTTTDSSGHFSFHVSDVTVNTELRVEALVTKPLYSSTTSVHATVHVAFHRRVRGRLTRLYGTASPAANGSLVEIQQQKLVRSGRRTGTYAWVSVYTTRARPAAGGSRFSLVERIAHAGHYRAYVKLAGGAVSSGASGSLYLHAAPRRKHHRH